MKKLWILGVLALSPVAVAPTVAQADTRIDNAANLIERRIEGDGILRPFNFRTDTFGRTIRIRGKVDTNYQRRRAIDLARRFRGPFRIESRISVRYPRSR